MIARLALALALPLSLGAQIRASERGAVSQVVDGTTMTIEYSRPTAHGRTLFGGVVRWGETWTPGANWATTLEVDRDVHVNGQPLPKGKYTVWMIPQQRGDWTVLFDRNARLFHVQKPAADAPEIQLRVSAKPEQGAPMETLAWYFPVVDHDGATLRMHWGTTVVPLHLRVDPSRPPALAADEAAVYLGSYRLKGAEAGDTTGTLLEVFQTPAGLRARVTPGIWPEIDREMDLIPAGPHRFRAGLYQGGKYFDTEEMYFRFVVANGRATAVEGLGGDSDQVYTRGERIK